jgi:hypothetical protein
MMMTRLFNGSIGLLFLTMHLFSRHQRSITF